MAKQEYRPPRQMKGFDGEEDYTEKVGLMNGNPDHRGNPTVRVVCEGRRDRGTGHEEDVIATFWALPFDAAAGERGEWMWDADAAVGGGKRHPSMRVREVKDRRKVTPAEAEAGWRWPLVEAEPKVNVGTMGRGGAGGTIHLTCPHCPADLHLKEAALQDYLDEYMAATVRLEGDMAELLRVAGRSSPS